MSVEINNSIVRLNELKQLRSNRGRPPRRLRDQIFLIEKRINLLKEESRIRRELIITAINDQETSLRELRQNLSEQVI